MENHMELCFDALSVNESFARMAVVAFMSELDPTLEEMADVKTAVSEAVTNSIVHGYTGSLGYIFMNCQADGKVLTVTIKDNGKGIEDIKKAMDRRGEKEFDLDLVLPKHSEEAAVGACIFAATANGKYRNIREAQKTLLGGHNEL